MPTLLRNTAGSLLLTPGGDLATQECGTCCDATPSLCVDLLSPVPDCYVSNTFLTGGELIVPYTSSGSWTFSYDEGFNLNTAFPSEFTGGETENAFSPSLSVTGVSQTPSTLSCTQLRGVYTPFIEAGVPDSRGYRIVQQAQNTTSLFVQGRFSGGAFQGYELGTTLTYTLPMGVAGNAVLRLELRVFLARDGVLSLGWPLSGQPARVLFSGPAFLSAENNGQDTFTSTDPDSPTTAELNLTSVVSVTGDCEDFTVSVTANVSGFHYRDIFNLSGQQTQSTDYDVSGTLQLDARFQGLFQASTLL